jgi:hypothetical protein
MADTVQLELTVKDSEFSTGDFLPMNFVTPNDDGCNDFFSMEIFQEGCGFEKLDDEEKELFVLPNDNCIGHFVSVIVYNRWGRQVFENNQRDFRWYPDDLAVGVYYYTLTYSDKVFKGSITVQY